MRSRDLPLGLSRFIPPIRALSSSSWRFLVGTATILVGVVSVGTSISPAPAHDPQPALRKAQSAMLVITAVTIDPDDDPSNLLPEIAAQWLVPPPAYALLLPATLAPVSASASPGASLPI